MAGVECTIICTEGSDTINTVIGQLLLLLRTAASQKFSASCHIVYWDGKPLIDLPIPVTSLPAAYFHRRKQVYCGTAAVAMVHRFAYECGGKVGGEPVYIDLHDMVDTMFSGHALAKQVIMHPVFDDTYHLEMERLQNTLSSIRQRRSVERPSTSPPSYILKHIPVSHPEDEGKTAERTHDKFNNRETRLKRGLSVRHVPMKI